MTEETARELLETLVPAFTDGNNMDWMRFVAANKRVPTATLYLHLKNEEAVFGVHAKMEGHKVADGKGKEHKVLVEYAPFLKVPRRKAVDKKEGTIEKEASYIAFLEELERRKEVKTESAEAWLERRDAEQKEAAEAAVGVIKVVHTPLLDFMREKKARELRERKKREEERRLKIDSQLVRGR
eukprot:CAMPEP_0180406964 /NCGR_PEP_ID=MMETSP0989-20121125/41460_1 /TAXON_ID=697907 /ORGANISM="non described non described, Strain CCMP2293" /LENGTH=182 /DNA_ID=CAMNT_0022410743 /DNA_START=41 /DNA_END=586 /DNA_ORIENTATION=-